MGLKVKQIDGLQSALDAKAAKATVTGATKTKITYNGEGIVTAGADLGESDIPALSIAKTTGLQTALDSKVDENAAITGATKCKITYDAKGLVTAGADLTSNDLPTVPVTKGGTGKTSVTSGSFLKGAGTAAMTERTPAEVKSDLELNNVTNHAQVKKTALETTVGNIPQWGVTTGDQLTQGLTVETTVRDSGHALDTAIATEFAVRKAIDQVIGANDAMVYKGAIDCSTNPNYPAAVQGETYKISVAGKIGGASGVNVEVGDMVLCITDSPGGTHAAEGSKFNIIQTNTDGVVIGPATSTTDKIAVFDGTSGKLIKQGTKTIAELVSDLTVNEVVLSATNQNSGANNVLTITGFFSTLPATNAKVRVMINGLMLFNRSTATYTDSFERDGSNLKIKVPYAIDATDEIQAVFATK